jgi:hypothetical protein
MTALFVDAADEAKMRFRVFLLALTLFASPYSATAAPTFAQAADQLDGEWRGGDFVLRVDSRRAQASVDAARPFEWEHFLIKEVSDSEIIFAVGAELFEAKLDADVLTLTSTSFRGARVLMRETSLRGTTSE